MWCRVCSVASELDWFPQFRPDIPVGPIKRTVSHPSWTNRIIFAWMTRMFNVVEYADDAVVSVVNLFNAWV